MEVNLDCTMIVRGKDVFSINSDDCRDLKLYIELKSSERI